jgi:hypothetical protein
MKKILWFLIAAILFAACNGNGDKKTEGANLELDSITDSIRVKVGESTLNVDAKITYPTNAESIKKDLMELVKQIGQGDDFDGYPDSLTIDTTDMRSLVNYVVKSKAEWLKADFGEDVEPVTPMSYSLEVNVLEETDKYITMGVYEELMFSGPHPNYTSYGITYLKPDGKKVKLGDLDAAKTSEIKDELLTKVKDFFTELTKDDELNVDDIVLLNEKDGKIDWPVYGLFLLGDSAVFSYQMDELAPYAFGMPDVRMSLKEMKAKGWLGKTLSDFVE